MMSGALEGRYAVITGANQGLGAYIARRYVEEGASVALCARDVALLEETASRVRASAKSDGAGRVCLVRRMGGLPAIVPP